MKKIVTILMFAAALISCGKQDTVYKPFVKEGGYIYPAKPIELKATSGYQRILLEWDAPMDPSIRTTKLFWDNYSDSLVFSTSDYQDGSIQVWVDNLDDRSYTFDVVNYDAKGHKSLATEITTTPFGESWLLSHAERSFLVAKMDGEDAVVSMSRSTDEMVATQFRYKTTDGDVVESDYLKPGETEIRLPKALRGKRIEYRSAFFPANGVDTVWFVSWQKSNAPIYYQIDASSWGITTTKGQVYNPYTANKIFDGVISSSSYWHSSRSASLANVFPKILAIDSGLEGDAAPTLVSLVFCQNASNSQLRYIRDLKVFVSDEPFDPNDSDPATNYGTPVIETTLVRDYADVECAIKSGAKGRYMAVMFTNSYNSSGYITLWELILYGYVESEVD